MYRVKRITRIARQVSIPFSLSTYSSSLSHFEYARRLIAEIYFIDRVFNAPVRFALISCDSSLDY